MPTTVTTVRFDATATAHEQKRAVTPVTPDHPDYGKVDLLKITTVDRVGDGKNAALLDRTESVEVVATLHAWQACDLIERLASAATGSLVARR